MKKKFNKNYLDNIPVKHPSIAYKTEEDGLITLEIENTGWANRITQKLFKRPKISYVHLDEFGSFVWSVIDGEKDITLLGNDVKERFGDKVEPLYPRLAKYISILKSYNFIIFKDNKK